jgi:hypothetical protein
VVPRVTRCAASFDREIMRREGEGPVRRGFFRVDPLTGQNRQNRLGRPRVKEIS